MLNKNALSIFVSTQDRFAATQDENEILQEN